MKNIRFLLKNIQNKTLMVVFPHPDDETVTTGGLLLLAKEMGFKTVVAVLTQGEAGEIHVDPKGKSLGDVRKEELKKALSILKVDEYIGKNFGDAKLRKRRKTWFNWLSKIITKHNPGVLVTYDHSGISGHPDHIVLSLDIKKIVKKEFKEKSSKPLLLWVSVPKKLARTLMSLETLGPISKPTHELKLGLKWFRKWMAMRCHKSQYLGSVFQQLYLLVIKNREWYHKVDLKKKYPYKFVKFDI